MTATARGLFEHGGCGDGECWQSKTNRAAGAAVEDETEDDDEEEEEEEEPDGLKLSRRLELLPVVFRARSEIVFWSA